MQETNSNAHERHQAYRLEVLKIRLAILPIMFFLGICLVFIIALTRVNELIYTPIHLPLRSAIFLGLAGGFGGLIIGHLVVQWISRNADTDRGKVFWIIVFFAVTLGLPFIAGAILPLTAYFMEVSVNNFGTIEAIIDGFFRALMLVPRTMIITGATGLFAGALVSGLFCILIASYDRFCIRKIGPINSLIAANVVGVAILVLTRITPADVLSKLG
jgi:hypothetical protein